MISRSGLVIKKADMQQMIKALHKNDMVLWDYNLELFLEDPLWCQVGQWSSPTIFISNQLTHFM